MYTSLREQIAKLETDYEGRILLARIRWETGFSCPQCGSNEGTQLKHSLLIQCTKCRKQTSPTANTFLHGIKRIKSFLQIFIKLCDGTLGTTKDIAEEMNLPYKTAWNLTHKARILLGLLLEGEQQSVIDCFDLKPALIKRSCESTAEFIRSTTLMLVDELCETVQEAVALFPVVFYGISRKYCQLYLNQLTRKHSPCDIEIRKALQLCCRGSPLTRSHIFHYRSPPAVLIGNSMIRTSCNSLS